MLSDDALIFEVTPLSLQNLTVTFEHPFQDSLVTGRHWSKEIWV